MEPKDIDAMMENIKNDKRSANEVFMSIANQLVTEHNVPEEHALDATRNLIGLFETVMEVTPCVEEKLES